MDLDAALRELVREWKRIKRAIARLEAQQPKREYGSLGRRGRKSMAMDERLEVSRRMKEYWKSRRASDKQDGSTDGPPA